jgi:hypothetical protein
MPECSQIQDGQASTQLIGIRNCGFKNIVAKASQEGCNRYDVFERRIQNCV